MNDVEKKRIKGVLKYTWPLYIVSAIVIVFGMNFIFGITHRLPAYKSLTLFISGEVKDDKKLRNNLLDKYQQNELKSVSIISAKPAETQYFTKLTVAGYNSADILIIPLSKLENLNVSAFSSELEESLINDYYQGYDFYNQESINYGIKVDKTKVQEYMTLPEEECYMFLNGKSQNIGEYGVKPNKEHSNALNVVKDWGSNV